MPAHRIVLHYIGDWLRVVTSPSGLVWTMMGRRAQPPRRQGTLPQRPSGRVGINSVSRDLRQHPRAVPCHRCADGYNGVSVPGCRLGVFAVVLVARPPFAASSNEPEQGGSANKASDYGAALTARFCSRGNSEKCKSLKSPPICRFSEFSRRARFFWQLKYTIECMDACDFLTLHCLSGNICAQGGQFMLSLTVRRKDAANVKQLCAAILLIGMAFPCLIRAQYLTFNSPVKLADNVANQGSPALIYRNGTAMMYYVNHTDNTIYVDVNFSGNPSSTGIAVNSAELTDVGAALFNSGNDVLLSYVPSTCQCPAFATSTNGINFGAPVYPSNSELGLGSSIFDFAFVPAVVGDGPFAYVASVGTNSSGTHLVYISYTQDGSNFVPVHPNGVPVSSYGTVSRPSLAVYNNGPWVAFTEQTQRQAIAGPISSESIGIVLPGNYWGQSNRNGNYAGLALVYDGYLYAFGQDTSSSQIMRYMWYNGASWGGTAEVNPQTQMRWTPSLALWSYLYLVYQDDSDTNISYRHAIP